MAIWQPPPTETPTSNETKLTITGCEDGLDGRAVCITPGTLSRSVLDGESAHLPDGQDLANTASILLLSRLEAVLGALVEWASHTGGWEAPCWREAEDLLRQLRSLRLDR